MGRKLSFDKDHVLAAASRLFGRQGYHAASIRDLAGAMNIPLASLYHSFTDKDGLFLACVHRHAALVGARLERLETEADLGSALRNFLMEPPDALLLRAFMDAYGTPALNAPLTDVLHDLRGRMESVIGKGQDQGSISQRDRASDIAQALFGAYLAAPLLSRTAPVALQTLIDRYLAVTGAGDFKTLVRIKA
jgi:TetR/AcrR family transcriptional repressor of nem operon